MQPLHLIPKQFSNFFRTCPLHIHPNSPPAFYLFIYNFTCLLIIALTFLARLAYVYSALIVSSSLLEMISHLGATSAE